MPRALLSVSDKRGLPAFAAELRALGWELIASGGTSRALIAAGLDVTPVTTVTGLPEMLGGRVKTLHPAIHTGILAREEDETELRAHGYASIALVACNLYPFRAVSSLPNRGIAEIIEQIDIGGVALLRAAAKNYARVITLCDPEDYAPAIAEIRANHTVSESTRQRLAAKTFAHTRDYDAAIYAYFAERLLAPPETASASEELPARITLELSRAQSLRYGENPHQPAAFYHREDNPHGSILGGQLLGGKALSYNNLLDLDAAWRTASSFEQPTVVIVKHRSPTGIASADTPAAALHAALASDPLSAFGGVIACNREMDIATASALGTLFVEAIAAPAFSADARTALSESRPNCRLLAVAAPFCDDALELRSVHGGFLAQRADVGVSPKTWKVVTQRAPTDAENAALQFAWRAVRHVPSNAIVVANARATLGIGGGLPSRVDAVLLACAKAGERANGAALASDAFFPFADGLEAAAAAGVRAVVQPGGSIRDAQVIAAADNAEIAMVFTGQRHFRH